MIKLSIKHQNCIPKSPPEAKLNNTFNHGLYSGELSKGIKNNIKYGAIDINSVEPSADSHNQEVSSR